MRARLPGEMDRGGEGGEEWVRLVGVGEKEWLRGVEEKVREGVRGKVRGGREK